MSKPEKNEKPRLEKSGLFRAWNHGGPPRGRTENLLIKSKLLFVHRRAHQSTVGTILRLKAKIVPTGKNKLGLNSRNIHAT